MALLAASLPLAAQVASASLNLPAEVNRAAGAQATAANTSGSRFAIGIAPSTLGIGGFFAARLTSSLNVRVGGDFLGISHSFPENGLSYEGKLRMRSAQATVDWYFWKSLHVSPGALLYNGNQVSGSVSGTAGQSFTLNGTTYTSSSSDPITGSGSLTLGKPGPMLLVGIGNPVPRGPGHFAVTLDIGVAYVGSPQVGIALSGSACDASGNNCEPVSAYPGFSSDLTAQEAKYQHDVNPYRFYPVLSLGFSFSFGHQN
ncbi:MAG: hypothetical protein ACRD1M_17265 [Terriglobales bacterium]